MYFTITPMYASSTGSYPASVPISGITPTLPVRDLRESLTTRLKLSGPILLIANGAILQDGWTLADYGLDGGARNVYVVTCGKDSIERIRQENLPRFPLQSSALSARDYSDEGMSYFS